MNKVLLTFKQERTVIDALTALGWTSVERHFELSAHAIAEVLQVSEEHAKAILLSIKEGDGALVEFRLEHEGSNLAETGHVIVNYRGRWHRREAV